MIQRKAMPLLITDEPLDDLDAMAQAAEMHRRIGLIGQWINEGHIEVREDNDPGEVTLQIEDERFTEARNVFPTSVLVAKLTLAINAGRSHRHMPTTIAPSARYFLLSSYWGEIAETAYHNVAKLTATVIAGRGA